MRLNQNMDEIANFAGLKSLKTRRLVFDAAFVYKILNGEIDCPESLQKVGLKVPSFNSRHNPLFAIQQSKTNYFSNSPMYRLPTLCNQIKNFDFFFFFLIIEPCTTLKTFIYNSNN
jgi:hypothetical protein